MKKILITIFSTALILTGCQTKNGNIDDSLTNQTRGINHNLDEVEKNLNYKIYARGNETSLIKPATLNLITIGKEDKDIKLSNGFAVDISDVVDLFNEYLPGTYSEDDVLKLLREDENFKETNKQLDLNNTKNDIVKYYDLDKIFREQLNSLDTLDPFTRKHSENVGNLTCRLCQKLKLDKGFTIYTSICGFIHDIGKMFIDPKVLQKEGKLTQEEFEIMKTHTTIGYEMCMNEPKLRPYSAGPLYHHEALDGTGYPNRTYR